MSTDEESRAEAGRDWWPLAIGWAGEGAVPQRPAAVVRPDSVTQVSAVLAACNEAVVPVTATAGRSGVCGGAVPVHGGVALDMTGLDGLVAIDETSLLADVRAGTFGPDLEASLGSVGPGDGYTLGHWPQSMDLSTVGGWLACRGAGQYSTRYGKIEDMVVGLEVVLADGHVVRTEGLGPRAATGPNLTQLFVGSEGTLGIITEARLRVHPRPSAQERRAFGFPTFASGLEACRRILRRGATPAVLRLYDRTESARNFEQPDTNVLVVLDEADPALLGATMAVVDEECGPTSRRSRDRSTWISSSAGSATATTCPPWPRCGGAASSWTRPRSRGGGRYCRGSSTRWCECSESIEGTLVASAHQSHAYTDGACLYFTFAGRGPEGARRGDRRGPPQSASARPKAQNDCRKCGRRSDRASGARRSIPCTVADRAGSGCLDRFPRTISGVLPGLLSLPHRGWDEGRA